MHTSLVPYDDQKTRLEAFVAGQSGEKRPMVILCHAWQGRNEFICEKAQAIADMGYVGFALDIFGKDVLGKSKEENAALKKPFIDDRLFLQRRLLKAFEVASRLPYIDPSRIAVLGYGFGGICALDLARSGVDLKGAISVYGHFDPPPYHKPIRAKVLALHGYNDPITKLEELRSFEKEMNEAKVDWQVQIFGNTMHAFVVPTVNDPAFGTVYNPISAQRAWRSIQTFLEEVLA
jgi:dienelactone hydrolase